MIQLTFKPKVVKSYIKGDHQSICESCPFMYRCKSYDKSKKVFYCSRREGKK